MSGDGNERKQKSAFSGQKQSPSKNTPCLVCGKDHGRCARWSSGGLMCYRGNGEIPAPPGYRRISTKTDKLGESYGLYVEGDDYGYEKPEKRKHDAELAARETAQLARRRDRHSGYLVRKHDDAQRHFSVAIAHVVEDAWNIGPIALRRLETGCFIGDEDRLTLAFPERLGDMSLAGLQLRDWDPARKRMLAIPDQWVSDQPRRGILVPKGELSSAKPVYLCEGARDTLALMQMRLQAIGRPSNKGGAGDVAQYLSGIGYTGTVVVLAEADKKPDGSWPGMEGAQKTAAALADALACPVRVALPPNDTKDVFDWWSRQGLDCRDLDACILAGQEFVEDLAFLDDVTPDRSDDDGAGALVAELDAARGNQPIANISLFPPYKVWENTTAPEAVRAVLRDSATFEIVDPKGSEAFATCISHEYRVEHTPVDPEKNPNATTSVLRQQCRKHFICAPCIASWRNLKIDQFELAGKGDKRYFPTSLFLAGADAASVVDSLTATAGAIDRRAKANAKKNGQTLEGFTLNSPSQLQIGYHGASHVIYLCSDHPIPEEVIKDVLGDDSDVTFQTGAPRIPAQLINCAFHGAADWSHDPLTLAEGMAAMRGRHKLSCWGGLKLPKRPPKTVPTAVLIDTTEAFNAPPEHHKRVSLMMRYAVKQITPRRTGKNGCPERLPIVWLGDNGAKLSAYEGERRARLMIDRAMVGQSTGDRAPPY